MILITMPFQSLSIPSQASSIDTVLQQHLIDIWLSHYYYYNLNKYVMLNRSYLNHVTMIESECEPRKKQALIPNFTKSPLRDRENRMNLANTPNRANPKPSLSPLRSRRTESSITNRVNASRRKSEPTCINDPHKTAKYLIYSEEETLHYCEKCAILLASQGFPVIKLQAGESMELNPRKEQVDSFLGELEVAMGVLSKKKETLNLAITNVRDTLQQEEAKVEEYYSHFYEIIDEHKRRVLEQLKEEYESSVRESDQIRGKLQTALSDSQRMKDDICESMDIILFQSDEKQYRPVMSNYQNTLKDYKNLGSKVQNQNMEMRRLNFKDPEAACNALQEGLQIHWQEWEEKKMEASKQSDCPENPVEIVELEEKFTKSSLREIGNLFSSFDE